MNILTIRKLTLILVLATTCAQAESIPSASELLDRYTQALDATKNFVSHYELADEYSGRIPAGHPFYYVYGKKSFRYKMFQRGELRFKDDKGLYHSQYAWGYFNEQLKNVPEDRPVYILHILTNTFDYFNQLLKERSSYGSARREDTSRETIKNPDCFVGISHLLGYVDTDERLDKVLRKANRISVREATEIIHGSACPVIDADTKYGQFSIWLDPNHGYHPARVRHIAKEGQYCHQTIIPKGSTASGYADTLKFEQLKDVWVPVEVNAGFHRTIGSPKYYMNEDVCYKRTGIILNPDHDKLGSFDDPILENPANDPELVNGTRLRLNRQQPEYIWQDNKVVDDKGHVILDVTTKKPVTNKP